MLPQLIYQLVCCQIFPTSKELAVVQLLGLDAAPAVDTADMLLSIYPTSKEPAVVQLVGLDTVPPADL